MRKEVLVRMPSLFDLHCDTLTRDQYAFLPHTPGCGTLDDPAAHLAVRKMPPGVKWVQCFAVFIPDSLRGQDAIAFYERYRSSFYRQTAQGPLVPCRSAAELGGALHAGKSAALLTVEGGAALAGQLERVQRLKEDGVCMMTLTWNGPNELGSGHDTQNGLTAFGREAVAEMERCGMLVDVSHLNDRGFEDLLAAAKKPFTASHSNARAVCGHRRNLPDAFIREMTARGCLIGLNFARPFLSETGGGGLDGLYRHVCHFLELDAGDCLALGSDYDGTDIHPDLDSVEKALSIRDYLIEHGIRPETAEGIVYGNAERFFQTWLI